MNNATLTQATLLALTMQNQAFKVAPLSRATHSGMCINRNITIGETVGLYYNSGDSLLRMGNVPSHSGDFWVDDENRFYCYDSSNHRLLIKNGLSGDTIDDTLDAYDFVVAGSRTCCAYKSSSDEKEWVVIKPDGSMTSPISIISTQSETPSFGYRNGIIAVCVGSTGSWGGADTYTYTEQGDYLNTMYHGNELAASVPIVLPINSTAVGLCLTASSMYLNYPYCRYVMATTTSYTYVEMWSDSGYSVYHYGTSNNWLCADQSYVYVTARQVEDDEYTGVRYTAKFSIDDYDGLILLGEEVNTDWPRLGGTQKGTIAHKDSSAVRTVYDLATMTQIYGDVLPSIPGSTDPIIRENDGYIWISGVGVYQKTPNGWLMYPTSVYPRDEDDYLLGYAIRNVKVGHDGLAIVLFE